MVDGWMGGWVDGAEERRKAGSGDFPDDAVPFDVSDACGWVGQGGVAGCVRVRLGGAGWSAIVP